MSELSNDKIYIKELLTLTNYFFKPTRVCTNSLEFNWGWVANEWGLELVVQRGGYFDNRYSISLCFIWGKINIKLPFKTKLRVGCNMPRYGVYLDVFARTLVLHTGGKFDESIGQVTSGGYKSWDLPFVSWQFEYHWIMDKNKNWRLIDKSEQSWDIVDEEGLIEEYDYTYTLKSGEVQKRKAKCHIERRQWKRKWFPWSKMVHTDLNIEFNDEVGERTGSWKGGCVGTGYKMKNGESMEQCLRRMEKERIFK